MTILDSILKSRDITLPTKVCLVKAGTYASEGALIDFVALTAAVALFFQTFYADEGSDITCPTELLGNIVGEEGAIGEELKVAVAVVQEKVNESLVEKGFAS